MEKKRIEFIDLAKGVCIIWVILWHANTLDMDIPGLNSVERFDKDKKTNAQYNNIKQ